MNIQFANRKLEKEFNDAKLLKRKHGERRAKLIANRMAIFDQAKCLADLGPPYRGPYRCHELRQNRSGQLSVDLDHPYRLIFRPSLEPAPTRVEGGLNWSKVTDITILEIVDTHE